MHVCCHAVPGFCGGPNAPRRLSQSRTPPAGWGRFRRSPSRRARVPSSCTPSPPPTLLRKWGGGGWPAEERSGLTFSECLLCDRQQRAPNESPTNKLGYVCRQRFRSEPPPAVRNLLWKLASPQIVSPTLVRYGIITPHFFFYWRGGEAELRDSKKGRRGSAQQTVRTPLLSDDFIV